MAKIHPTALVDSKAELADDVSIGAYCVIRGEVTIGPGTLVDDHTHIRGRTIIGGGCRIGPAAYVGLDAQDSKYKGETTSLIIGDEVIIRELASIHRSNKTGPDHATRIGSRCFIMVGSHVAHDCEIGEDVVMANGVLLGGHVTIGAKAFLGGGFVLHQFCRVGRLAIVAGNEALSQDVPPFGAVRERGLRGYNAVGCRRAAIAPQSLVAIRATYRLVREHRQMTNAVDAIRATVPLVPEVVEILEFVSSSRRGLVPSLTPLKVRRQYTGVDSEDFGD